jgi:hypothetical protein
MGQRVAVQKQQWRPITAMPQANSRAAGLGIGERKAGHDFHELLRIGSTAAWRAPWKGTRQRNGPD